MPHPVGVYSFNECSLTCCSDQGTMEAMLAVVDRARAWMLVASDAMVKRLTKDPTFAAAVRGARKDSLELLLEVGDKRGTRSPAMSHLAWRGSGAVGLSAADATDGGCALSWPCGCGEFKERFAVAQHIGTELDVCVRHASSVDHLLKHWHDCFRAAKRRTGRPKSVIRVDAGLNGPGEVPHIHFKGGGALNVDGVWKHGSETLNSAELAWLATVGWASPSE